MTADAQPSTSLGQLLLALQDEDLHADQLVYRLAHLPSRVALDELARRRGGLVTERQRIEADQSGFVARSAELERQIAECDERLQSLDRRLTSGQAGSYRDEAAIGEEIASVGRRKHELEDQELEIMEQLEPFEAALATVALDEIAIDEDRKARVLELEDEESTIAREQASVFERREAAAAAVPEAALAEYERLRSHLAGVGVARLVHNTCSGCNLALPATELDRIRHLPEGTLAHCEQCGRILVP